VLSEFKKGKLPEEGLKEMEQLAKELTAQFREA
jgi:hypothetical protein